MKQHLPVIRPRSGLSRTCEAIANGKLSLGFLGGSITATNERVGGMETNWPLFIRGFFLTHYPQVALSYYNAGIGGTCSLSGLLRVDREILAQDCDLVFVEYAVNDDGDGPYRHSREGLLRRLLEQRRDVVLVYTYRTSMYAKMQAGEMPDSVAVFEELAERYQIPSVWMGLHAFRQIEANRLSWEQFLPREGGRLHPLALGSGIYAEPVIEYLKGALAEECPTEIPYGDRLPQPVYPGHYQFIREIPMDSWQLQGSWYRQRVLTNPWYHTELHTDSANAALSFRFIGHMLAVTLDCGKCTAVIRWRLDGGEWKEFQGNRPDWAPDRNWLMSRPIVDDLPCCEHLFEMQLMHGDRENCYGTECTLYGFTTALDETVCK